MRARLAAYGGYQLRDFLTGRVLLVVLATAAGAWAYGFTHALTPSVFFSGDLEARSQLQRAFDFTLAVFAFVAAAVAAQGLVSRDRVRGYHRVLFSRPVSPVRYYVQGFTLAGVASVTLASLAASLYAAAVHRVSTLGVAAYVGLAWLVVGSLALLLSALTRGHAVLLAVLLGADFALDRYASALHTFGRGQPSVNALQFLLPPGHVVAALADPFTRGALVEPKAVAWPLAFGVACLIVATVLLRRRPFRP